MTRQICYVELPAVGESGTPFTKMPDCPNCELDELAMSVLLPGCAASCLACGAQVINLSMMDDQIEKTLRFLGPEYSIATHGPVMREATVDDQIAEAGAEKNRTQAEKDAAELTYTIRVSRYFRRD